MYSFLIYVVIFSNPVLNRLRTQGYEKKISNTSISHFLPLHFVPLKCENIEQMFHELCILHNRRQLPHVYFDTE